MRRHHGRLLLADNGPDDAHSVGEAAAFEAAIERGMISDYRIIRFVEMARAAASEREFLDQLDSELRDFRPDAVIVRKLAALPFPPTATMRLFRSYAERLIYEELDAWGIVRKPLPAHVISVLNAFDAGATCARGWQYHVLRKAIRGPVMYRPHGASVTRFTTDVLDHSVVAGTVVMLGNRITSRIPGYSLPGSKQRLRLAEILRAELGDAFMLYGSGWGPSAGSLGRLSFSESFSTMSSADVTVGFDHFPFKPYYFSDRLPIAMLAGRPHVTNWQPGYSRLLPGHAGVMAVRGGPSHVAEKVFSLLAMQPAERKRLGDAARAYARAYLSVEQLYRDVICLAIGRTV